MSVVRGSHWHITLAEISCSARIPPTQGTVNQSHYVPMTSQGFMSSKEACRLQLKCDGTRRTGGEVKGKLANGVGSQYSSHYLGT